METLSSLCMTGMGVRVFQSEQFSAAPYRRLFQPPPSPFVAAGSAVAKYAGINLHKRLVQGAAYKNKDYALSLKEAFLGTDTDMRSSAYTTMLFAIYFHTSLLHLPCQVLIFQEMPLGARQ